MLRRHMERFFLHFLLLRSQIGFISFFFDFSSFLLALRLWIHSRLICVCVCVWWVRYGSCRNLVNETNGKYIICSNCKPQNCAVSLPQTKLIGISNDRKQCPREQEIYGLVFGFFGVSVVVVVLLPAFVRVEICNGLVLQRGAWRLSVLLLLLFGTIYVSRFSLVDFRSLLSLLRSFFFSCRFGHYSLSDIHTKLIHEPQFRMCHAHITVSKLTERIRFRSRYAGYLFFNFSAIVCMLRKSNK